MDFIKEITQYVTVDFPALFAKLDLGVSFDDISGIFESISALIAKLGD